MESSSSGIRNAFGEMNHREHGDFLDTSVALRALCGDFTSADAQVNRIRRLTDRILLGRGKEVRGTSLWSHRTAM